MVDISYLQAIVIGILQGITELFPISSLGHSVLLPAWLGGDWSALVTQYGNDDSSQSPYLAFIVALHVATAIALLVFYWRDWVAIIGAWFTTIKTRSITTSTERLAWLIVIATIPVGVTGLVLEHTFRVLSLYGIDVEQPASPTLFASATEAWTSLPSALRTVAEN